MSRRKVEDVDYVQFLIAAQRVYSCTEAARCQQEDIAHDAFTRLLTRQPPDTEALWQEVKPFVARHEGILVADDSTLDKPHARKMELVTRHWSGKHRQVVRGINLLSLLWTDGDMGLPCDCRVYEQNGLSKNEGLRAMLSTAKVRGFAPSYVAFDSWYNGLDNLKAVRQHGWHFFCRLKCNRLVNPDGSGNVAVESLTTPEAGLVVHLKGYGFIRVFRTVAPDGDAEYWATSDLEMNEAKRQELERQCFVIENYHRAIKQCCGIERAQVRKAKAQHNHILFALRAFVRLECNRIRTGLSGYEAKTAIVRQAIRSYLISPTISLPSTA